MRSFTYCTVFLLALTAPAALAAAEIIRGRCHMDYCSWFSITEKDIAASSNVGVLFKVRGRHWSSYHPGGSYDRRAPRKGGETTDDFVLCSKSRPSVLFPDRGAWIAHVLAPGRPDSIYGYNETSYIRYFAVCHGVTVRDAGAEVPKFARHFGYPPEGPAPEQIDLAEPEDILQ